MANETTKTPPAPKNDSETLITISKAELKRMIEDAILDFAEKPRQAALDADVLGKVIGDAVATGMQKNTRPKVTIGQYLKTGHSSFHPKGPGPALLRRTFQNDAMCNPATLYDREVELLNRLTHSGRYIDRLVEVEIRPEGAEDVVYIRFNNRTPDQQIELKGHVKNFIDMLEQIVTAQEKEREEQEMRDDMAREQRRQYMERRAKQQAAHPVEA